MKEAAECLKMTAHDLLALGVTEKVIPEPENFREGMRQVKQVYYRLEDILYTEIRRLSGLGKEELLEQRYQRFRKFGVFEGNSPAKEI